MALRYKKKNNKPGQNTPHRRPTRCWLDTPSGSPSPPLPEVVNGEGYPLRLQAFQVLLLVHGVHLARQVVDVLLHQLEDALLVGFGIDVALTGQTTEDCILAADKVKLICTR